MMTTLAPSSLALRPYQHEAIDEILAAISNGINRPLVSLPTGTGKTVVFAHLLAQRGGRGLVLAHRDELLRQAADKLMLVAPGLNVGIVKAGENQVAAQVVVASVQTLSRPNRLEQLPGDIETLVVDEAHHAVAPTYLRILEYLGAFNTNGPLCVGFTATPERGDGAGLGAVWQKIVYQKTILEMLLAGYLCDLRAVRVSVAVNLNQVRVRGGDYAEGELGRAMMHANAPAHVVAAYQEHAAGRKTLVFTPTVDLAHAMAESFESAGVRAEALDGQTPDEERRAILRRLHSGETQVVANCAVLTEGFDEPSIDCVIVARPTKSKPLYIQMVGRGTRIYPGKEDCLVLDVVGATSRHDLITASTIFDLDLSTKSAREAAEERDKEVKEEQGYDAAGDLVSSQVQPVQTSVATRL